MKRFFLFLIVCVAFVGVKAQPETGTISLIPRVGVSIANLSSYDIHNGLNDEPIQTSNKAGFVGGLDIQYQLRSGFALSAGIFYSQQGCSMKDHKEEYKNNDGNLCFSGINHHQVAMDYINVPLSAHFYVADNLSFNAGVQFGYLISAKWKWEETDYEVKNEERVYSAQDQKVSIDRRDDFKKLDISIPIGISYEYENVVLDARYNIPCSKVADDIRNKVFMITAGYKFNL